MDLGDSLNLYRLDICNKPIAFVPNSYHIGIIREKIGLNKKSKSYYFIRRETILEI